MESKIDPICGMEGHIPAYGHYFCSNDCIEKYRVKHGIKHDAGHHGKSSSCPSCHPGDGRPWYKHPFYITIIAASILFIISYIIKPLNPVFSALVDYLKLIWWAVLLGFLIGGVINHFVPREYIEKYLSRHKKRTILYSVAFGFLMSACSHGILAIAIALYKKGANTSSVVAFLLASPWANLPITILLFGFFGLKALAIILSALVIAVITGLVYQVLERRGIVECDNFRKGAVRAKTKEFSITGDVKRRWGSYEFGLSSLLSDAKGVLNGSWALSKMVLWWLFIGMMIASFVRAFVPQDFFMEYMGATTLGLVVTLMFATIIEVCSEGSSPLAFELFKQTGAFGNSFVFLMAGVATDYTEIGLIWSNIGKKAAIWLPIITLPQIFVLGYLFNLIF